MIEKKLKNPIIASLTVVSIALIIFAASCGSVFASGGSIALANIYPQEGCTYSSMDNFSYQLTAVNTNTTVSVSIDGGPLIPMIFQGITNEVVNGDTVARDWYTWQVTVPTIANSGNHTFQFFSHYYVWQDAGQYWSELNACSTIYSFTIKNNLATQPTATPTISPNAPQLQAIPGFQPWIIIPFIAAALLSALFVRKRIPQR